MMTKEVLIHMKGMQTLEHMEKMFLMAGRPGGMPQMVFEYILKKNGIDPKTDLSIDQSISFGLTAAAFTIC